MEVRFRNSYTSKVWVAVMYYDPADCGEYGNWETKGWWGIDVGATKHPFNTNNRYAAFYAEADDGAIWTGPYGPIYIYQYAFTSCLNLGSTGSIGVVGLRRIDTQNVNWTVNLVA